MIPKVSRSGLEAVSRRFPTTFGAESEFRDFGDNCCYYGVCGEGGRIPSGRQMKFVINVIPKTFANQLQIQPWHSCDYSLIKAATLDWLH